jgi:alpha-tubulin suppressor-like RCC1 family protein
MNQRGALGDNTEVDKSSPVQTVTYGINWSQVSAGYLYTAAIKTDGTLWCWGENSAGQLGNNTVSRRSSPVQTVAGGTNWKQVSCGYTSIAAIKTDGTLWGWGYGNQGQLGNNKGLPRSSPVQTVTFGTNWKQVSTVGSHTAAIKTDGTLWTWGDNSYGQLGDNTIISKSSPVQTVTYGTNWKQVSCGNTQVTAIKTDGTLWCWGRNSYGKLGDNTTTNRSSPVQTSAYGKNWKQVSAGGFRTAAIQYQDI